MDTGNAWICQEKMIFDSWQELDAVGSNLYVTGTILGTI
jgi:hypothetical protein